MAGTVQQVERPNYLAVVPYQPDTHLDPKRVPAQDRDIHLVELKYCPDTNPLPSLQKAVDQHAGSISRLRTRSLRNPNRNNKVTLHTILLGVA
eukprot:1160566-Pelagomonas_calceolata.AAC.5